MNLENKTVLIVGSNVDIDGRGLGSEIDSGMLADVVIRVNKAYGDAADVGTKTDIIFTRWRAWLQTGWFSEEQIESACEVVALNENFNFLESWKRVAADEVGAAAVSCGAAAVFYALVMGAKEVKLIGFGFQDGKEAGTDKIYCRNAFTHAAGTIDENAAFDFAREREWLKKQALVSLI